MKIKLKEIRELFTIAEDRIKQMERLGEGLQFPAVNQLRYVAFHLLRASTSDDEGIREDELREAKYHCQRSIHDSMESGIAYYLEEIHTFQVDYRKVIITNVINNYLEICKIAHTAQEYIVRRSQNSISDHSDPNFNEHQRATELFYELKTSYEKLGVARNELNKQIQRQRIAISVGLGTLALTGIGILINLVF